MKEGRIGGGLKEGRIEGKEGQDRLKDEGRKIERGKEG